MRPQAETNRRKGTVQELESEVNTVPYRPAQPCRTVQPSGVGTQLTLARARTIATTRQLRAREGAECSNFYAVTHPKVELL